MFFACRLSAFVVHCFQQAKAKNYIPVDDVKMAATIYWILNHQNENGSFSEPPNGRVIHTDMQVCQHRCSLQPSISAFCGTSFCVAFTNVFVGLMKKLTLLTFINWLFYCCSSGNYPHDKGPLPFVRMQLSTYIGNVHHQSTRIIHCVPFFIHFRHSRSPTRFRG